MNTLHRYLMRQIIPTLVMTVLVFAFVLLLGNLLRTIVGLLVNRQTTFFTIIEAISYLMPYVLMYALPMGMLTATLLCFGRFSADQELTAVRAGGVSLLALSTPVFLLAVFLSGISTYVISLDVAPRCHGAYRDLLFRVLVQGAVSMIPEGRFVSDDHGLLYYIGRVKADQTLREVKVYQQDKMYVVADTGRVVYGTNQEVTLVLYNPQLTLLRDGVWQPGTTMAELPLQLGQELTSPSRRKKRISEMTFTELRAELRELGRRFQKPLALPSNPAAESRTARRDAGKRPIDPTTPLLTEIHSRLSFAFSCFSFTLVGIPLAIRAHRRETSVGVALALILAFVFHVLIMLGESLATRPEFYPYLIVWLPNLLFQGVGCVLLWRANRGV